MQNIEFHPIAEIFPLIHGQDFVELKADIKANGVIEPIWIYEGMILDGRNRFRACQEVGVIPEIKEYTGDSPASFVVSLNMRRRHLTASQKAAAAVEFLPWLESEAKARQGKRTDLIERKAFYDSLHPELVGSLGSHGISIAEAYENIKAAKKRQEQIRDERVIYFISSEGKKIKVGISIDPEKRLREISSHNQDCTLLGSVPWVEGLEKDIHRELAEHHLHGEWFEQNDASMKVAEYIISLCPENGTKSGGRAAVRSAREASKMVGVSHGYVSDAKKIKEESPEEFEKLKTGETSISQAKKRASQPESDDLEREPEAKEPPKSRGVGVRCAHEAIAVLKRIPLDDGLRQDAFNIVTDWIETNRG